jgi:hypothetical protein
VCEFALKRREPRTLGRNTETPVCELELEEPRTLGGSMGTPVHVDTVQSPRTLGRNTGTFVYAKFHIVEGTENAR